MTLHRITLLVGAMLFGIAGSAQAAGDITIVRDLAGRVGPVIGSAQACRDIARPRIQSIVDKFSQVIREASSNEAERSDLTQTFDRTVTEGRAAVTSGRIDCIRADRQLADLERSISGPSLSSVIGPSPAAAATAAVAIPYALERRMLFFGAFTGSNILRNDPPDRYVFNYRASYAEETDSVVRYLVKIRRLQPRQIAVFAQQDSYGDAGFAGVAKAFRAMGVNDSAIVRLNYARNTVDVDDAINQLKLAKPPIKAVVMVATYRAAARFIEKTRDLYPGMIYSNVSFVGSTALAEELKLLGPRYTNGVIVTQVVPAVSGYSSAVLEYKNALAKYFPGEAPDYVSLEGYVAANVLIQGIKRAGPQVDTERLIDTLETMRNLDLGLATSLGYGRSEHQASHKIWGTALDETGAYQSIELE